MGCNVEIWTGISGTGKTHELLGRYCEALRAGMQAATLSRTLWLTPTNESRQQILRMLLHSMTGVLLSPNVMTFPGFAEKILRASNEPIDEISPLVQQRLVRAIIDELNHSGQLPYYSPIAETSGFLQLVISFIAELKRDEIWPERFAEIANSETSRRKDRELSLIYSRYQQCMLDAKRYDSEGRFWAARDVADRVGLGPFAQLSLVVVDGFTDFTHTQYELLAHLARETEDLLISLPLETPSQRSDVFAKPEAACDKLKKILHPGKPIVVRRFEDVESDSNDRPAGIRQIAKCLFANPRHIQRANDATGICVLAVTGENREIEVLAERVKRLILSGVSPREIVIAFHQLNDNDIELVRERFSAAGIPIRCDKGRLLVREPQVRAFFDVMRLELEDWPFERLMSILRSNWFRPAWDIAHPERAVRTLAQFLRSRKLHSQRHIMLQALAREFRRFAETDHQSQAELFQDAYRLLECFSEATRKLEGRRTFFQWAQITAELVRELGIVHSTGQQSSSSETLNEDRPAIGGTTSVWEYFERLMFDAAKVDDFGETESNSISLREFSRALMELLETQRLPALAPAREYVRILDSESVRNLDISHLFLAGLTESRVPSGRTDDCLYGESERRRLNEHGFSLGHRSSHSQDEMLLFYSVVTRARQSLVLSYSEINSNGNPLFPSPYVKAILDVFEAGQLEIQHVGSLDPVPSVDHVLTMSDWRRRAVADVREQKPGLFAGFCDVPELQPVAANLLASVDANVGRFRTKGWTRYEGVIENATLKAALRKKFPADYQFSPTQLENYATCGFRYFLSDVLNLDPLETPYVVTDYRLRGVLAHSVLSVLHSEWESASDESLEGLVANFRNLVDHELGRRITDTELHKAILKIERRLMHDWAGFYGEQLADYLTEFSAAWDQPPVPRFLETPFGDVPDEQSSASEDAHTNSLEAMSLGEGENRTLIRGRIDRIDVGTAGSTTVFNVIDYKTGRPPKFSPDDVRTGRSLQLALYTLAIDRFHLIGTDAQPFQMGYWSLRESGFAAGIKGTTKKKQSQAIDEAVFHSLETLLEALIPKLARGIREGLYPVDNDDHNCAGMCPYSGCCRVSQTRRLREPLQKRSKIAILEETESSQQQPLE
ncbi:MAG: hypothetical protein Tsb009_26800 [Planctomycetaceae bacterium]